MQNRPGIYSKTKGLFRLDAHPSIRRRRLCMKGITRRVRCECDDVFTCVPKPARRQIIVVAFSVNSPLHTSARYTFWTIWSQTMHLVVYTISLIVCFDRGDLLCNDFDYNLLLFFFFIKYTTLITAVSSFTSHPSAISRSWQRNVEPKVFYPF